MDIASPEEHLEALIEASMRLDREAFGELYRLFAPKIQRFIAYQTHDRVLAEDLTNQTFIRAMDAIARYEHRSTGEFTAWLYRIAKNVVVDHWRAARDTVPLEEGLLANPSDTLDSQFDAISRREELRKAMRHLTDDQREVITYRFAIGLSHAEIGRLMDRNEPAVRALQFRAIATLRNVLQGDSA
ncbi:MAG: RNA polymerase sigma factor [Chloroflexi bacterium]|nr:RNA polymerase sigma factor [Chloroflexota bacterium]